MRAAQLLFVISACTIAITAPTSIASVQSTNDRSAIAPTITEKGASATQQSASSTSSATTNSVHNDQHLSPESVADVSLWFRAPMVVTFVWIFVGICGIFGYRMWWNSPIHPSFFPFAVVAFAVVVAYSIVLSLNIASGSQINFEVPGQKFTGASGPVVLWVLSFLTIMYGFSLTKMTELANSTSPPNAAVHEIHSSQRPPQ